MGFAERLGELLDERGLSGRELARRIPCDRSYVSQLAKGRRRPSPEMAARIDKLLGAGGQLAELAAPPPPAAPGAPVPRADGRYVEGLRESSQALVRLDTMHGGGDVLPLALRSFRAAAALLATGAYVPAAELDLQAAVGEAAEVAAWIAYDADQQELSRQLINEALVASRLAGDRDMELMQLSHLSMQAIYLSRPAEALRAAEYALGFPRLAPRVSALFEIRRGRAAAQLGDPHRSAAAFARARAIFSDGTSPAWAWWVDETTVDGHEASARGDAGDWAAALPLLAQSAADRTAARSRDSYYNNARLLDGLAHLQSWTDAVPVMGRLTTMRGLVSSPRTTALLRRVTRRITTTAPPAPAEAARELASTLRS